MTGQLYVTQLSWQRFKSPSSLRNINRVGSIGLKHADISLYSLIKAQSNFRNIYICSDTQKQ